MTGDIFTLLGGIGLFLFGMQTMTAALRELASSRARQILSRFTRTPLTGAATGALTTAAIQSSSATMVTTVGFVGAGYVTFPQAIGILYGASVGTTITGWMVLLLGFKLQFAAIALPMLFVAAVLRVLSQGQVARTAMSLAGLSLVFLGIGMMQTGMAAYEGTLTPGSFPQATLTGRLQLLAIGVIITLVTQSSSAGVAGTLVLLGSGALDFEQGAALVIGMHIGTTFTALLASIGGSLAVRQTAVANVIYHVVTGVLALLFIDLIGAALDRGFLHGDPQLGLVTFHTGFNLIGTAVMLPLTAAFADMVTRLVPERAEATPSARLDRRLLADPGAALDTAASVLDEIADELFAALADALSPSSAALELAAVRERVAPVLTDAQDFLARIVIEEDREALLQRYGALLHQVDHLTRLHYRCSQGARLRSAMKEPSLARHVLILRNSIARHAAGTSLPAREAARLERLEARLGRFEAKVRHVTLRRPAHVHGLTAAEVFRLSDAVRWLRRSTNHCQRILHYEQLALEHPAASAGEPAPAVGADITAPAPPPGG